MGVAWTRRLTARNQMQLIVLTDLQPNMSIIPKRIVDDFGADDITIKRRASLQISHVQGDVIQLRHDGLSLTGATRFCRAEAPVAAVYDRRIVSSRWNPLRCSRDSVLQFRPPIYQLRRHRKSDEVIERQ